MIIKNVYNVYFSYGGGKDETIFYHDGTFSSIHLANDYILNNYKSKVITDNFSLYLVGNKYKIHESMNENNNYTYVGKREDCKQNTPYNKNGGFIIEETIFNKN